MKHTHKPHLSWAAAARMVVLNVTLSVSALAASLELTNDPATAGPGQFVAEELRREAAAWGMSVVVADATAPADATHIKLTIGTPAGTEEAVAQSYSIRVQSENGRRVITVRGADAVGAMYGGLDIAEAIRTGSFDSLKDSDHTPYIKQRGIKFNIPLDVRTPTYTGNEWPDSARLNVAEMWSKYFWREQFDDMARHRYNVMSWWSLNPFPSIVKVPEFPSIALDDGGPSQADRRRRR